MADNKNFFDYLKENGIDIEAIAKEKAEDLLKKGYEKISDEAKDNINAFLQYIPGLATEALQKKDAIQKSKKMLEGAYKISITDGMHLAKSKATKGAYRGSLLTNTNNQVAGQAEIFKMEGAIDLIQAPKYALCFFDTVSLVTGQYYMAEINSRLTEIENKTDRILDYLENSLRGELWANDQILNEIIQNYDYIRTNELQRTSYYDQVLLIKKDALAKMKFFDLQLASSRKRVSLKSKAEDIERIIDLVAEYYPQYWYTIYLYAKSIYCEIALAQIIDPNVLVNMKNSILDCVDNYKRLFKKDKEDLTKIIENAKAYNLKKLPKLEYRGGISSGLGYKSSGYLNILAALLAGYDAVATGESIVSDKKKERKEKALKKFYVEMEDFDDVSLLNDQALRIDEQINRVSEPIDIIQNGEEVYIRYTKNDEKDNE